MCNKTPVKMELIARFRCYRNRSVKHFRVHTGIKPSYPVFRDYFRCRFSFLLCCGLRDEWTVYKMKLSMTTNNVFNVVVPTDNALNVLTKHHQLINVPTAGAQAFHKEGL
jgi:hypothetical protein